MQANSIVRCVNASGAPMLRRGGIYIVRRAYGKFLDVGAVQIDGLPYPGFFSWRFQELAAPLPQETQTGVSVDA